MVVDRQYSPGWRSLVGGLLAGGLLVCWPESWAGKLREVVHDGLSPGQCMVAATISQAVSPSSGESSGEHRGSSWERQARYWQAEAARLKSELDVLQLVPSWPAAQMTQPLVTARLRSARVIGWERPTLVDWPTAILRGGTTGDVQAGDLVLAPEDMILDHGQEAGIASDDLVLAGRRVVGRIQKSSRWTSMIQAVTDPEFRGHAQIVRIQDGEAILGAEGTLAGGGDHRCKLLHVDGTEPVTEGDLVYTALRGVPLSPPLFYGTVSSAVLNSNEPHWSIEVRPAHGAEPLKDVLILQMSLPTNTAE